MDTPRADPRSLGDLLRRVRVAADAGPAWTAEMAGLSAARLAVIESGETTRFAQPTCDEARAVCSALGTSVEALLDAAPRQSGPWLVSVPPSPSRGLFFPSVAHLVLQRPADLAGTYADPSASPQPFLVADEGSALLSP